MLWTYLVIVLVLISELQAYEGSEEEERILDDVLIENIRRKCLKNGNDSILEEYEEASRKFEGCISTSKLPTSEEVLLQRICTDYPNCLKDFMEKVDHCLSIEETFLTDLLLSSFKEHCKNNGELFKAKIEGMSNITCDTPLPFVGYAISMECHPKLKFMHHKNDPDFLIKKSDTCSDLKTLQNCVVDLVPKMCGSEESTKYASVFLETSLDWCDKYLSVNEIE